MSKRKIKELERVEARLVKELEIGTVPSFKIGVDKVYQDKIEYVPMTPEQRKNMERLLAFVRKQRELLSKPNKILKNDS